MLTFEVGATHDGTSFKVVQNDGSLRIQGLVAAEGVQVPLGRQLLPFTGPVDRT